MVKSLTVMVDFLTHIYIYVWNLCEKGINKYMYANFVNKDYDYRVHFFTFLG